MILFNGPVEMGKNRPGQTLQNSLSFIISIMVLRALARRVGGASPTLEPRVHMIIPFNGTSKLVSSFDIICWYHIVSGGL